MPKINPYSLTDAQQLVDDALSRSEGRHNKWRTLESLFRTGLADGTVTQSTAPARLAEDLPGLTLEAINMALPHMTIIIASSVDRSPEFVVEPYASGGQGDDVARFGEELLNYQWKRLHGTSISRDMVQDMVILGNGFGKVGWQFSEEEVDLPDDEITDELAALMEVERRDATLSEREPRSEDELLSLVDAVRSEVTVDEPWLQYVSPYDIFVPATARRLDEARWIAQRIVLPMDEVKSNPAFSNVDTVSGTDKKDRAALRATDEEINEGSGQDDPFAEATIYEFYDMRARRLLVFQLHADKPLYEGPLPYSHRYTPFIHMRNFEDGGSRFWAFGDLENMASMQVQLNDFVHEQMSNALRAGNKYAIDENVWDARLKEWLESDQSDLAFPIQTNQRPLQDVIQVLQRPGLSADVYAGKDALLGHMAEVLGLNDFQMGGVGADRMSATAAAVVDGTATLRASDKRRQVEAAISRGGLLILLLCQEFLDVEQAIRVVDDWGVEQWLDVSADDLVGEFEVNVQTGSTQAVNPATRQQRAVEMMTAVIPALAADGYDTHPLWRRALRDYGMDPDRLLRKVALPPEMGGVPGAPPAAPGSPPSAAPPQAPSGMEPAQRADVQQQGEVAI